MALANLIYNSIQKPSVMSVHNLSRVLFWIVGFIGQAATLSNLIPSELNAGKRFLNFLEHLLDLSVVLASLKYLLC